MTFNVNFPPSFGVGEPARRPANPYPPVGSTPGLPQDTVTFGSSGSSGPKIKIESIHEFYEVLKSFETPENFNEEHRMPLAWERSAREVAEDGDKVAALLAFLRTGEGRKVCVTVAPFNQVPEYREMTFDGTDVAFRLTFAHQNTDKTRPETFPMLTVVDKSKHAYYAVYDTQRQIVDDYKTNNGHGPVSDQAEEIAREFEELTVLLA